MLAFNKLTGLYGILAILTGFELSPLQLTTYIYSILVLGLLAVLIPHIKKQSPFECLSLAWLHIIDTLINCACTTFFAVQWYFSSVAESNVLTQQHGAGEQLNGTALPLESRGASTVLYKRLQNLQGGVPVAMPHDTAFSFVLIAAFTLVRIYFSLIVAAYAQQVLIRHVDLQMENDRPRAKDVNGPFAVGTDEGEGWKGRVGRVLVSLGRSYWLDYKDQEEWAKSMNERFRKSSTSLASAEV